MLAARIRSQQFEFEDVPRCPPQMALIQQAARCIPRAAKPATRFKRWHRF